MKFGFEVAKKYYDHDHKTKKMLENEEIKIP